MTAKSQMLTSEEFASLLTVGNTSAVTDPPAIIPTEHRATLIALGYMADLSGRLRMTTPGRHRIAVAFEQGAKGPLTKSKEATRFKSGWKGASTPGAIGTE
jgi:hypothetical protein